MAIRLFDNHPYDCVFQATVTFVGDGFVVLDQTLFYPLSGNQQCDKGTLNGIEVSAVEVEVQDDHSLDLNAPIKHFVDITSFTLGQKINGAIDALSRRRTMRLHTASHLVEHFISQETHFVSVEGSFVSDEKDRTGYRLSQNLDANTLKQLEDEVNEFIRSGESVIFKQEGSLRIWCCGEIHMACCGTHVENVSEVGRIQLSRKNKGKGINRIEISLPEGF